MKSLKFPHLEMIVMFYDESGWVLLVSSELAGPDSSGHATRILQSVASAAAAVLRVFLSESCY